MAPKSIKVPFIKGLEKMSPAEFNSAMALKASSDAIDSVNWPDKFPACPLTSFRIARSEAFLAVSFCVEGPDLLATQMGDNGRSWEDSCCEVFISPDGKEYFNFETTCIGSVLVEHGTGRGDREKLPRQDVAKVIRRSSLPHEPFEIKGGNYVWKLDIMIPFALLGLDGSNLPESVGANLYKCGDNTATPHYVSWSPIEIPNPDFHRPEFFGKLILK